MCARNIPWSISTPSFSLCISALVGVDLLPCRRQPRNQFGGVVCEFVHATKGGQVFCELAINRIHVLFQEIFAKTPACGKNGFRCRLLLRRSLAVSWAIWPEDHLPVRQNFCRRRCVPFERAPHARRRFDPCAGGLRRQSAATKNFTGIGAYFFCCRGPGAFHTHSPLLLHFIRSSCPATGTSQQ